SCFIILFLHCSSHSCVSLLTSFIFVSPFLFSFFFLLIPPPPRSTLFPYTTLFRSTASSADDDSGVRAIGSMIRPSPRVRTRNRPDRKSTRLNSSHEWISYAVFCLKKKKKKKKKNYHKKKKKSNKKKNKLNNLIIKN